MDNSSPIFGNLHECVRPVEELKLGTSRDVSRRHWPRLRVVAGQFVVCIESLAG